MKRTDQVVFISGMYARSSISTTPYNILEATRYAKIFWLLGYTVFCPHMNTNSFEDLGIENSHFYDGDIEILQRACDIIVMIPNFSLSTGAKNELFASMELKKTVWLIEPTEEDIEFTRKAFKVCGGPVIFEVSNK